MRLAIVRFESGAVVAVEVAIDPEDQRHGLSGRHYLRPGWGMLFELDGDLYEFTFERTLIPLDVLLIEDNCVIQINENVPAGCAQHISTSADYALEVNAGWVKVHGVRRGDWVKVS